MNPGLQQLQAYPFEKLAEIRRDLSPAAGLGPINMSLGEPQHPTPVFVQDALIEAIGGTGKYPPTRGSNELREACARWLIHRFQLPAGAIDPDRHVLPVNGTREALFSIAQCVIDRNAEAPIVAMPNPFYQIYEGAALLAGATPFYLPYKDAGGVIPDFDAVPASVWERCQMLTICSPGNPSGAVLPPAELKHVLELATKYDFVVVSDECYSELYYDEENPPNGLLQAALELGMDNFERCIVMHSLSKRSNAPGLRSGFAAGDASIMGEYLRYRTYHGCAMPIHVQAASIAAWSDENHVIENRRLYRKKFDAVVPILNKVIDVEIPPAGFYLWPDLKHDDVDFCRRLIAEQNVITLPGRFLARDSAAGNPGTNRIRIVLTDEIDTCIEGINRIATLAESLR